MSETFESPSVPANTERRYFNEEVERYRSERWRLHPRLTEAFKTARLEALGVIDHDLEEEIERVSKELAETTDALNREPDSLELLLRSTKLRVRIESTLWIQAELREILRNRQNEAKPEGEESPVKFIGRPEAAPEETDGTKEAA
jgi:hypothetical protein